MAIRFCNLAKRALASALLGAEFSWRNLFAVAFCPLAFVVEQGEGKWLTR
jgi:hypothetical protein